MVKIHSNIIQFRGNHYDFGYHQGKLLKDSKLMHYRLNHFFKRRSTRFNTDVSEFTTVIKHFSPEIYEEILGLKDALEIDLETAIQQFGGYFIEYGRSGCSIFTDETYMIRNYDNDPQTYEGRLVLYAPNDGGYATIGPTMQMTGRTDGINEKGLAMGYNFTNRKQSINGFMCNMIGRLVLEKCANVGEAIDFLKELPHRTSFSYVLMDQNQSGIIVEASPRRVIVRHDNVCTNHFIELTEENRYRMDDSIRRSEVMKTARKNKLQPMEAYQLMNDPNQGVLSTNYGAWSGTIHTALFDVKNLRMGFALGGYRMPYMINFGQWVEKGKDLNVRRINGELDTKINVVY